MSARWLPVVLVVLVGACAETGPTKPVATRRSPRPPALAPELTATVGDSEPVTITFDWGAPCTVPAVQHSRRDGNSMVATFDVSLRASGDEYLLSLATVRVLSVNGTPVEGALPLEQTVRLATAVAMPTIRVSAVGDYVATENVDATIDAALAALGAGDDPSVKAAFEQPMVKAATQQLGATMWNSWVGGWAGAEVTPGETRRQTVDVPTATGRDIPMNLELTHRGQVAGAERLILLVDRQSAGGEEIEKMTTEFMRSSARGAENMPADVVSGMRIERTTTAAVEPSTAKPYRVQYREVVSVPGHKRVKVTDTAFDWANSVGCD